MKIEASLPKVVRGIEYFTNSHFIKLTKDSGESAKLPSTGVIIGVCRSCGENLIAFNASGKCLCTHCGSENTVWFWSKPQLAFVSEEENAFSDTIKEKK